MIKPTINRGNPCPLTNQFIISIVKLVARSESRVTGGLEINFVSEALMKRLNREYRGKDVATDVLSFAWGEVSLLFSGNRLSPVLGQLYLSYSYISRQAKRFGVSAREETVRMLIHGLLHLAGYDHERPEAATDMFARQEGLVARVFKL